MKILEYLWPENPYARWIIYALLGVFVFWFGLLLWSLWQNLLYRRQIKRCTDVGDLLKARLVQSLKKDVSRDESAAAAAAQFEGEKIFDAFQDARGLKRKHPITRHLRAIFDAGWNESQFDARGLIKNTSDEVFRVNSLHRSLLSIFIILGLLGTLFGLADTLAALDTILRGSAQLNNDNLSQGLRQLLGTLKGAFAPSIWGVSLTVFGVLLFAFYVRFIALPLGGLIERLTLTVWVPQLVPTASQKALEKLQLSREQMERSVEAAQQVTEFADDFQHKAGTLRETLGLSTDALKQMSQTADRLNTFSKNFVADMQPLKDFQEQLHKLYQQMSQESRAFQESVQSNIAGAQDFQEHIQGQLKSQHR